MLTALLGRKIGTTQVYDAKGEVQNVTVVQAGPCSVLPVSQAPVQAPGELSTWVELCCRTIVHYCLF